MGKGVKQPKMKSQSVFPASEFSERSRFFSILILSWLVPEVFALMLSLVDSNRKNEKRQVRNNF